MTTYKKINNLETGVMCAILKDDRHSIPLDEANTDYQEYLAWLSEGNTPEEAE